MTTVYRTEDWNECSHDAISVYVDDDGDLRVECQSGCGEVAFVYGPELHRIGADTLRRELAKEHAELSKDSRE